VRREERREEEGGGGRGGWWGYDHLEQLRDGGVRLERLLALEVDTQKLRHRLRELREGVYARGGWCEGEEG
tara:strand:- start:565 stop:777 length:213 start_codon:yes stop_codon:yes gene_type:complete